MRYVEAMYDQTPSDARRARLRLNRGAAKSAPIDGKFDDKCVACGALLAGQIKSTSQLK